MGNFKLSSDNVGNVNAETMIHLTKHDLWDLQSKKYSCRQRMN